MDNSSGYVRALLVLLAEPDEASGCWLWTRATAGQQGYGRLMIRGKITLAHVASYREWVGPVPSGLQLDHLCRQRSCINPDHLEPVTQAENARRGLSGVLTPPRSRCPKGHDLTPENRMPRASRTDRPSYRCRTCHNADGRAFRARRKARATN